MSFRGNLMAKIFGLTVLFLFLTVVPLRAADSANTLYVGENDVIAAVEKEFTEQGLDDEIDVEIFAGQSSFVLEDTKNVKLMVSKLKYDESQNKFECGLDVFADGKQFARTALQGRYYRLEEIAVPAANINKGETLNEENLKMVKIRSNRIKPNHITTLDKLLNMEARRSLKEGRPVSDREVGKVLVVKKGDMVTLVLNSGNMQITAKAEALTDGAKGDKIEALNTKSKKKVYGTVLDADTIEVTVQ